MFRKNSAVSAVNVAFTWLASEHRPEPELELSSSGVDR